MNVDLADGVTIDVIGDVHGQWYWSAKGYRPGAEMIVARQGNSSTCCICTRSPENLPKITIY